MKTQTFVAQTTNRKTLAGRRSESRLQAVFAPDRLKAGHQTGISQRVFRTACAASLLLLLLFALPAVGQAQMFGYTNNYGLWICTSNNGAITINRYAGSGGDVTVPDWITNVPVTTIGYEAFFFLDCTNPISVTIADTVTNIGNSAFVLFTNLTAVTIGTNVTSIGEAAFLSCTSLTNLMVPDSVTSVGQNAFDNCYSLVNAKIGNGVTSIPQSAFYGCQKLTILTVGNGVTNIGQNACTACTSLTSLTLGTSLTSIGQDAFDLCISLTNLTIPNNVTSIGSDAFGFCGSLTNLIIGTSVNNIGDDAFYSCTNLARVYFLGSAPSIDSSAFYYDTNATFYYLPGTIGWDKWSGPPPAVLWNPLAATSDGSFGVQANQFGFNVTGTANIPIVLEACTNLASSVWVPLLNGTLTNGSFYFSDPDWANYSSRFYRFRSP